jgi:hypothetical protein
MLAGRPARRYIGAMTSRLATAMVILAAILSAVSCASSSGMLLDSVQAAEGADQPTEPPEPPVGLTGLEIRTEPGGASVWINNRYQGTTPLVIEDLPAGSYRLLLTLEGYHEELAWLDYPGGPMRYRVSLDPVMGFVQVDVRPRDAGITLDGRTVPPGITAVAVGFYDVVVSAFGYAEWMGRIEIWENNVSTISVDLEPTPFSIMPPVLTRAFVNPENPGLLGRLEARFDVSGPGSATATIFDLQGRQVFREDLPPFTTWSQRWTWHPSASLPDGEYSFVVSGTGDDGRDARQEISFGLDRSLRIAPRSTWSGGSGLMYAPTAEVLPAGSFQASLVGLANVDPIDGDLQAPVQLAFRTGLGADLELDVAAGAIFTAAVPPISGSLSLRWQAVAPMHPFGFGVALEAKASLQGVPGLGILTTDTFANFSGLGLGVPLQLTAGALSLLFEPAVVFSAWHVDYASDPVTLPSPASWMYWRVGLMVDTGAFVAGISASARSLPLPDGLFSIDLPFQAAAEFSCLVPDTHLLIGAAVAGEFDPFDTGWYLMGGVSLGLLF